MMTGAAAAQVRGGETAAAVQSSKHL